MKVAAPLTPNIDFHHGIENIDEWNIRYTDRHKIEDLIKICRMYKDKRLNIKMDKDISTDDIDILCAINSNIHFRLTSNNWFLYKKFDELGIKYFFDFPIYSYTMLEWVTKFTHTTDIYIYDDLCYNIPEVDKYCEKYNICIRMILNRIPLTFPPAFELDSIPIFRPEYSDILDFYIDTVEFDCYDGDKFLWNQFNVYYKRWFIDKKWNDNLTLLNKNLDRDIINASLMPGLEEFRMSCKHRCSMSVNNNCTKCSRYINMSKIMSDGGYVING